jgi:hypothetical protein
VRTALVVALATLVAACGAPATLPSAPAGATATTTVLPTRICDWIQGADVPPISCTEAIGGVLLALGPDALSVRAAWFRPGAPCPPNARCFALPPGSAYVVIRLEDGRVGLVRFAGEAFVGELENPTYDVWPRSGVPVPPVGRPDVGPGAPAEIRDREPLPLCGEEEVGITESRLERSCFLGAVLDGRPAEFVSRSVDDRGDPFVELYRFGGRGPVLVYRSASFVGPGWVRNDCAIGPAFDDAAIFVVTECLSTELS